MPWSVSSQMYSIVPIRLKKEKVLVIVTTSANTNWLTILPTLKYFWDQIEYINSPVIEFEWIKTENNHCINFTKAAKFDQIWRVRNFGQ